MEEQVAMWMESTWNFRPTSFSLWNFRHLLSSLFLGPICNPPPLSTCFTRHLLFGEAIVMLTLGTWRETKAWTNLGSVDWAFACL